MAKTSTIEEYESVQNYNFITKWFHSFRYKELHKNLIKISKTHGDQPIKVLEIGSAYGRLYDLLDSDYNISYIGIELYDPLYKISVERYGEKENAKFILGDCMEKQIWDQVGNPDVVIVLETMEHIPEHNVVRLVENISKLSPSYFICSVPVEIGPVIWIKNVGSWLMGYIRHKEYTKKETLWAGLYKLDKLPPHGTGHKGFDWRWLAQTIRHNFKIKKIITFPFSWLPGGLSTSVFFLSEPLSSKKPQ